MPPVTRSQTSAQLRRQVQDRMINTVHSEGQGAPHRVDFNPAHSTSEPSQSSEESESESGSDGESAGAAR